MALLNSDADFLVPMTYASDDAEFLAALAEVVAAIPLSKLVVGLDTVHDNTALPFTQAQLRFDAIRAAGVRRVGLWRAPVPDAFFPFLDAL